MYKKAITLLIVCGLILPACSVVVPRQQTITGSGKVVSETRSVSGFTAVSLEGSGNVEIVIGPEESVVVEAEDNILPLIETILEKSVLVIRTKPFTTIQTTEPIQIRITVKSLSGVLIPGSGNITVSKLSGDIFSVSLPGSGNITIRGTANQVDISLGGSGNIYCDQLEAKSATVRLNGSGNITVYARESLDARINGSGDIQYSGNPAKVYKDVKGSGNIRQ